MLVHNILEKSAKIYPDKVALVCGDERMTYYEHIEYDEKKYKELMSRGYFEYKPRHKPEYKVIIQSYLRRKRVSIKIIKWTDEKLKNNRMADILTAIEIAELESAINKKEFYFHSAINESRGGLKLINNITRKLRDEEIAIMRV